MRWTLGLVVTLVICVVASGIASLVYGPRTTPADLAHIATSTPLHTYGNANAPVIVTVYTDFECPHCKNVHENRISRLMNDFPGQLLFVYKNFPLRAHPEAREKAETAECVQKVGGSDAYWNYVSYLFLTQPPEGSDPISGAPMDAVRHIGLNVDDVEACIDSGYGASIVDQDLLEVRALGGHLTPTIYIVSSTTRVLLQGETGIAEAIEYAQSAKAR